MPSYRGAVLAIAALSLAMTISAGAQQSAPGTAESMKAVASDSLKFDDISVPGFDPGLKIAVLSGNPDAAGPYTLRLSFPAGYKFPPHWHPMAENLTVLTGAFQLAMGERVDPSQLKTYRPGDFLHIPAKHPHFGGVEGATVIQLHGDGPFAINLVDAKGKTQ